MMKMNKHERYLAVIFCSLKRSLNRKEWFKEINRVLGEKSCSFAAANLCYNEFQSGRFSLNDSFRIP